MTVVRHTDDLSFAPAHDGDACRAFLQGPYGRRQACHGTALVRVLSRGEIFATPLCAVCYEHQRQKGEPTLDEVLVKLRGDR